MVAREGVLLLLDMVLGSRWVPAWLVILARVVTWRCKWQLLMVCSSFGVWPALRKLFMRCLSLILLGGIIHGWWILICAWISCRADHKFVIHRFGVQGKGCVLTSMHSAKPAWIWYAWRETVMRLPKEVLAQRCLIAWIILWRPCSEGRCRRPSPPWEVGLYNTAFGIFWLYPIYCGWGVWFWTACCLAPCWTWKWLGRGRW